MATQSSGSTSDSGSALSQELEAARAALAFKAVAVVWREQESEVMRLCVTQQVRWCTQQGSRCRCFGGSACNLAVGLTQQSRAAASTTQAQAGAPAVGCGTAAAASRHSGWSANGGVQVCVLSEPAQQPAVCRCWTSCTWARCGMSPGT